jgi:hypothetical protein
MKQVGEIARRHGGVLPRVRDDQQLLNLYRRAEYCGSPHPMRTWNSWMYATTQSIAPFLILLLYGLAGNVVSVAEAKRDAMQSRYDVIRGARATVSFVKRRSRRVLLHGFKDAGRFSVPTLIRQVLEMTEPLIDHVAASHKDRMFLVYSDRGTRGSNTPKVAPLKIDRAGHWTRAFCDKHELRDENGARLRFPLEMLRTTRINVVHRKKNDIFVTQKVANHKSITTTFAYLKTMRTIDKQREMLADIQTELFTRSGSNSERVTDASSTTDDRARSIERDCVDPNHRPGQAADLTCPMWNYTITDPYRVIPPKPQFVAALLRDEIAYRHARQFVDPTRFARLYAPG